MASSIPIDEDAATTSSVAIIKVPDVARAFQPRKEWIIHERIYAVQAYANLSKRNGCIPQETVQTKTWLKRIDGLLKLHEYDFEISPKMRDQAAIDTYLKFMFDDPRFHFPQDIQDRARALYEEYEACNWSAIAVDDSESSDIEISTHANLDGNDDSTITSSAGAGNTSTQTTATVRLPPEDDPIWGLEGIMHGVAPKFGKIKTFVIDRRFLNEKRSANVFGHNGLEPGDWFPNQLVALFHGGHGARMAGIHGKAGVGAYSVVVSGSYKDVDKE